MMSYMLKITIRVCLLGDPVQPQEETWLHAAWSPSTGKAAFCKGIRGCHWFAEVTAFRVTLEHAQEHQFHCICIYTGC